MHVQHGTVVLLPSERQDPSQVPMMPWHVSIAVEGMEKHFYLVFLPTESHISKPLMAEDKGNDMV